MPSYRYFGTVYQFDKVKGIVKKTMPPSLYFGHLTSEEHDVADKLIKEFPENVLLIKNRYRFLYYYVPHKFAQRSVEAHLQYQAKRIMRSDKTHMKKIPRKK